MTTYYIRTTDPERLLALAVQIGLLVVTDDGRHVMADPHAGIWDPIGQIMRPTGDVRQTEFGDYPVMVPICDDQGAPYWHANLLLYAGELTAMAQAAYEADPSPELAEALASIPAYFVCDTAGQPVAPAAPARAFA